MAGAKGMSDRQMEAGAGAGCKRYRYFGSRGVVRVHFGEWDSFHE